MVAMVPVRIDIHQDLLFKAFRRFDEENSGAVTEDCIRELFGQSFDVQAMTLRMGCSSSEQIPYRDVLFYLQGESAQADELEAAAQTIDTEAQAEERELYFRLKPQPTFQLYNNNSYDGPKSRECCCLW